MKIILDTNVFISGIFWSGIPHKILKAWANGQITLIVSQEILDEYHRVANILTHKYPNIDLHGFMQLLLYKVEVVATIKLEEQICREQDDDKFIACALSSDAKIIVTGDADLLECTAIQDKITIITPSNFFHNYLL